MSKRLDQATFDLLLEAYRADPGNHSNAARHALVQRKTAKRAWEVGAPDKPWGVKPIKQLIAEDAELARSKAMLEEERMGLDIDTTLFEADRDREAVRQHAILAKKEEAILVGLARKTSVRALAAAAAASEGLASVMRKLGQELETIGNGGPLTRKEQSDITMMARRYAATVREVVAAGQMSMEMERLYLGEPTQIIGIETEYDAMPTNELVKLAGYQDEVLKRAQERGLVVLDGGLKKKAE